jgi:hypothetical protein
MMIFNSSPELNEGLIIIVIGLFVIGLFLCLAWSEWLEYKLKLAKIMKETGKPPADETDTT